MADKSATPPGDGFNPPQGDRSRDQFIQMVNKVKDLYDLFLVNYGNEMDEMQRLRKEQAEERARLNREYVDNMICSYNNHVDLLLQELRLVTEAKEDSGFEENVVDSSSKIPQETQSGDQPEPDHMENHLPPPR